MGKTRTAGALFLAALVTLPALPRSADAKPPPVKQTRERFIEMTVREVRRHGSGGHAVVLQSGDRKKVLPIWIGRREAHAIQMRLSKSRLPRPLTHDLLESTLAILGARVVRVEVMDLREKVFIGKLDLKGADGKRYRLDGRPSDLITLAVGAGLPVHVAPAVLERAGIDISGAEPRPPKKKTKL